MLEQPHFNIIISSSVIYLFMIICIRIFGKKELAQLSVADLVFVLLISNSVQNAMVGSDSSLFGGILAASTLFIINRIVKNILFRSEKLTRFMQGEPTILIRHGKINKKELRKNKISMQELEEVGRENGIGDLSTIDLAILEVDGKISILSDENIKKGGKFDVDEGEIE
ncbi:MAG: DUF421 domain-containing protein [Candidatus Azobacteroides sp.]|nr:DUF421 domain-containing protein [Candidatus Azobacteroides sp.]